jgi:hypothetical protein
MPTYQFPTAELLVNNNHTRLVVHCAASENRLREGMNARLRLASPNGFFTRLRILLTQLAKVIPLCPGQRAYCWEYLVVERPAADPQRLFPGGAKYSPADAPVEVTLEELLLELGGDPTAVASVEVRFNSEGGMVVPE